jgi:hypothetical protein
MSHTSTLKQALINKHPQSYMKPTHTLVAIFGVDESNV